MWKIYFHLFLVEFFLGRTSCLRKEDDDPNALNQNYYHYLMDNLDKSYSPCSQFYPYVCNKWPDNHKENKDNYDSVGGMLFHEINMEIKEYLETSTVSNMSDQVKLIKDFYMSCVEDKDYKPLEFMQRLEKEENMKWALLTPLEDKDVVFDWPSTMAIFRKYGLNDLLVEQWTTSRERFDYIKESDMDQLKESIPLPQGAMEFMDLWKDLDEFEDKFGTMLVDEEEKKEYKFKEIPYPWLKKYLSAMVEPPGLKANTKFTFDNIECLEGLDKLLKQYDDAFLCRYLEVRFLLYLEKAGILGKPNECLSMATTLLNLPAEWIYQELHPELMPEIPKLQHMFQNIIANVNSTLQKAKALDIIPQEFFQILETMQLQVGYLNSENATKYLEIIYGNLTLNPQDYYGNYLKLLNFHFELEVYLAHGSKNIFYSSPTYKVEAWDFGTQYNAKLNHLIIPLAVLRPPLYHLAYEDIFKHSALGSFIASKIFDPLHLMHGVKSSDIYNLADITSLQSPFQIYFSSLNSKSNRIEKYQTLFNITSQLELKQLFYINAVHYLCASNYEDTDRINLIVGKLNDFNDAFDCKLNKFLKEIS
uniref:Peptidase family M13 n=1 Tax=Musca domestica TaxID=7370 RepID=T1P859_MUSDO